MAIFNKFHSFTEHLAEGVHNLQTGALTIALCASANPPVASNSVLADLTQISYTNLSSRVLTVTGSTHTSGVYKLTLADLILTASGGPVAAFRYVVLYNDTPTSPADPLIAWWDYGSALTLLDGETLTLDFDASAGVLTVT
jgi:hypothetical protein